MPQDNEMLDHVRPPGPAEMGRGRFLRRAGLSLGTVAVVGAGALGYRAYDQGVFATGDGPAYAPWSGSPGDKGLLALVGAAILAPSPHNSQAWQFRLGSNHIDVYVDRTRNVGSIDPFRREMFIGAGTALENLVLAARANGYAPRVTLMPAGPDSTHVAHVALPRAAPRGSALAASIAARHTNRYRYVEGREVPRAALTAMAGLADAGVPDVRLLWYTRPSDRARIGALLIEATEAILADPDQSASDYAWFRQDWDEIQRLRDGITVDASGLSEVVAALAKILPAQSEQATGDAWLKATRESQTATAAGYGIVAVRDHSDNRERLEGGRLLERVHLWTTGNGLALHHMNQLTERVDREAQLGLEPRFRVALDDLLPSGWQALITFRVGYPTHTPRKSPRRPVAAVIVV